VLRTDKKYHTRFVKYKHDADNNLVNDTENKHRCDSLLPRLNKADQSTSADANL